MYTYSQAKQLLLNTPNTWLVTGVAGFIGSNLAEQLLLLNQTVIGIDNFYSGKQSNLDDMKSNLSDNQWQNFKFYNSDINNKASCEKVFAENTINHVLHHAAVCSVPYSIKHPDVCNHTNIDGFKNIIELSGEHKIQNFVYASSSAVYGDNDDVLKVEDRVGKRLSPYAESKYQNEIIAGEYSNSYDLSTVGLRYFNIYGKRQDPNGEYSAVIPKWLSLMLKNQHLYINGDGSTTRDFCYIDDVVQANILACLNNSSDTENFNNKVFNIGTGLSISLNELFNTLQDLLALHNNQYSLKPDYRKFITGDIKYSCPNITAANKELNFMPSNNIKSGLEAIFDWYLKYL